MENIVVILHINGARDIFLLFFDHQDTESESREMEICVAGPILKHREKYQSLYGITISILYNMVETHCGNTSYLWS